MEAFLMEVQRHATIAPTSPPRVAIKETQILGHTIPKVYFLLLHVSISKLFLITIPFVYSITGPCFVD